MKKIDNGQTVQIVANVGVIAGIVFLGVEISQNNELMEYQRRLSAFELTQTNTDLLLEHDDLRRIFTKSVFGGDLSQEEAVLFALAQGKIVLSMEWNFLEVPENRERLRRSVMANGHLFSGQMWSSMRSTLDPTFVEFVDDSLGE
jgi:hypothetical protein